MKKFVLPIVLLLGVSATFAQAQPYPSRPIRVVVPFPAAGNVDTYIRQLARQMEISIGQPLVIDNRSGANGIVGCDIVAKSAPDGYTILATSVAFAVNPSMYKSLPYNSERDFTPITNYANGLGYILVAHPSLQANNIKEVIEIARKQPLRYSSAGIGNGQHLAGELLAQKAGITLQHIPYKGGGPSLTAVLSSEVQLNFPGASVAVPISNRANCAASASRARSVFHHCQICRRSARAACPATASIPAGMRCSRRRKCLPPSSIVCTPKCARRLRASSCARPSPAPAMSRRRRHPLTSPNCSKRI